jgi:hypothetical protein
MKNGDASSPHALVHLFLHQTHKTADSANDLKLFFAKVEAPTLAARVRSAVIFRQQGHFDKAMLAMSEANRDQVLALRKIHSTLSGVTGRHYPMVVLEKFRQQPPFEIGVADGDAVFEILDRLGARESPAFDGARAKLHDMESQIDKESAFVTFLEHQAARDRSTAEHETATAKVQDFEQTLTAMRVEILNQIFVVTKDVLDGAAVRNRWDRLFLSLAGNIYVVVMSSIETKPAQRVEI